MSAYSVYIPGVYSNIDEDMIIDTFKRMKIGKVNRAILVPQKTSKHNKAYIYFDELYSTKSAIDMVYEIENEKSSKLFYARTPHVYWVLLENRRKIKEDELALVTPCEQIKEDTPHPVYIESLNEDEMDERNQTEIDEYLDNLQHIQTACNDSYDNYEQEEEGEIVEYEEITSLEPTIKVLTEEESSEIPIPDMSYVCSDYASALELEIYNLRNVNKMLQYNAHVMFEYYSVALDVNQSLTDQKMKWSHLIENKQFTRLHNLVISKNS